MVNYTKKSRLTGKVYSNDSVVAIKNINQAAAYMEAGVIPVDIVSCRNADTGKRFLIFYFQREDTKDVFEKWCKYELN